MQNNYVKLLLLSLLLLHVLISPRKWVIIFVWELVRGDGEKIWKPVEINGSAKNKKTKSRRLLKWINLRNAILKTLQSYPKII